ncbi:hypothetical protein LCGC14_1859880 [marine sediment metagenome]|uniref:Adenine-specific DNA methylase n=1 Tax=marine sediment metagenome TaxID=412755 RepID=A0A0F9GW98_9ZZZZ
MIISRVWSMPSKWTFTIKPIAELLSRYVGDGIGWVDPFAGENSPAEITNDLNPNRPTTHHLDALEFLLSLSGLYRGVLFDPPYSITQAKECYDGVGMQHLSVKPTSMQYWGNSKNEIARIIEHSGISICCGWTSQGMGKNRGFEMLEILLVPHGGSKNDTILTVERKLTDA